MSTSRRTFLFSLAASGAAASLVGCGKAADPAPVTDAPEPVDGKLSLEVARYPELSREGGAIALRVRNVSGQILVIHPEGQNFVALSGLCTHLGCPLGFSGGELECPCHGSRFDQQGGVMNGPAKRNLQTYVSRYDATSGALVIELP